MLRRFLLGATAALVLAPAAAAGTSIYATGLNNPRGLAFDADGSLYVAEGGIGGTLSTTPEECEQVPVPIGPYSGDFTASISEVSPQGEVSTLVGELPSSQTSPDSGALVSGVADVKFVGGQLYALTSGAGCSHGLSGTVNALLSVDTTTGATTQVADLSAFLKAHPVANPEEDDFEPDGTWYSMVPGAAGTLYMVEPNHGEVDRFLTSPPAASEGGVSRVVDVSAFFGHVVPTAIAYRGSLYVGTLGPFPIVPGTEKIYRVTPWGQISVFASGLTTVLGLQFDRLGRLYALESMTMPGFPDLAQFGSGRIVRLDPGGRQTTIAGGLTFPTAMTFGPDGALYVSNFGFGGPFPGLGQILRVTVPGPH